MADICDVKNILRYLGILQDGEKARRHAPDILPDGWYEDAPVSGYWYPYKKVGDKVVKGEELGRITDAFGKILYTYIVKDDGILLYQTASLGIEEGRPMVAYGRVR